MKLVTCADNIAVSSRAAQILISEINGNPDLVLCLPTGRTPRLIYNNLVLAYRNRAVSFSRSIIFNLDEYVGLAGNDVGSFSAYMKDMFIDHVDVGANAWHIPNGKASDIDSEAAQYDRAIAEAGGLDFVVLGVGSNGHIGFNEPGASLTSRTRVVELTKETLAANIPDLPREPRPHQGITIGIANIMEARKVLLVASGASKAAAIYQLINRGDPSQWPVAALCDHDDVTVLLDEAASGK